MSLERFLKIFLFLLLIVVLVKTCLCLWRIFKGVDEPTISYYLKVIDWYREFLKIAFLAFLAGLITFFWKN